MWGSIQAREAVQKAAMAFPTEWGFSFPGEQCLDAVALPSHVSLRAWGPFCGLELSKSTLPTWWGLSFASPKQLPRATSSSPACGGAVPSVRIGCTDVEAERVVAGAPAGDPPPATGWTSPIAPHSGGAVHAEAVIRYAVCTAPLAMCGSRLVVCGHRPSQGAPVAWAFNSRPTNTGWCFCSDSPSSL